MRFFQILIPRAQNVTRRLPADMNIPTMMTQLNFSIHRSVKIYKTRKGKYLMWKDNVWKVLWLKNTKENFLKLNARAAASGVNNMMK